MVQDQWSFYGTVGGAYVPRYSGSDESVAVPVFGFGVRSPYGIFLNTDHGLGWETNTMGSTFRIYVGPSASRKDHKKGLEGSNAARHGRHQEPRAGWFRRGDRRRPGDTVRLGAARVQEGRRPRHRQRYTLFNLGASAKVYDGPAGKIGLSLNSTFGDGNYMRTWYGVASRPSPAIVVRGRGRPGASRWARCGRIR